MLRTIITSKTRRKILELFFHDPASQHYLRNIVRIINEEVNAVKRELDILSEGKVLLKEKRQNKIYYTLNKSYIFYDDFLRLFTKSSDLARGLYEKITKIGKVKYAVVSTKFSKKIPINEDEIYLLLVGIIVIPEVVAVMGVAEKTFGREINYTVMTEDEFAFRKKNNDPFIWKFLKQPKIMLIGHEEDLVK
jgi:hypothetical protein